MKARLVSGLSALLLCMAADFNPARSQPACQPGTQYNSRSACDCAGSSWITYNNGQPADDMACLFHGSNCTFVCRPSCDPAAVSANLRWIQQYAHQNQTLAFARARIARAVSVRTPADATMIRKAYRDAHQGYQTETILDNCNDAQTGQLAYSFVQNHVQLQECSDPEPVSSAHCEKYKVNLRWSLQAGTCGPYSRYWLYWAIDGNSAEVDKVKAEWARQAMRVSQGHNLPVLTSVDFLPDHMILRLAKEAVTVAPPIALTDHKHPDTAPEVDRNLCPGLKLARDYVPQ